MRVKLEFDIDYEHQVGEPFLHKPPQDPKEHELPYIFRRTKQAENVGILIPRYNLFKIVGVIEEVWKPGDEHWGYDEHNLYVLHHIFETEKSYWDYNEKDEYDLFPEDHPFIGYETWTFHGLKSALGCAWDLSGLSGAEYPHGGLLPKHRKSVSEVARMALDFHDQSSNKDHIWYLYIVQCNDGSLYTGVTKDVSRRVWEHNNDKKKASRYAWSRKPVSLVYSKEFPNKNLAYREEYRIKKLSRKEKDEIIGM